MSTSKEDLNLAKINIPMIRRTFPELITNEIVGIQPMSGPVGLAFALSHQYKPTSGVVLISFEDLNGEDVMYKRLFKSVVGIEYKPDKVRVIREDGANLKRPKYISKERFNKRYFTEAL